jgi:hypothetical protein
MVYAAVGALADAGSDAAALAMTETRKAPGVLNVVAYAGGTVESSLVCHAGVAVITRGYWLARQVLARLMDQCGAAAARPAPASREDGTEASSVAALTASSAACTVQFYNGHLRIWMSTSDPMRVRAAAARIAGMALDAVDLRVLGDRDAPHGLGVLVPAIALARELPSAPVQLIVSYDLGLHCPAAVGAAPPRLRRASAARKTVVALAA